MSVKNRVSDNSHLCAARVD